jgi:hypothetical protein
VNKISRRWWFFVFLFAVFPQVGLLGQRWRRKEQRRILSTQGSPEPESPYAEAVADAEGRIVAVAISGGHHAMPAAQRIGLTAKRCSPFIDSHSH